ncbi:MULTISPECIES: SIR2 family NAD-dependent protein deacylase [Actinoalloteichus]|uniref:protein acetyllysine N-acetyltransferase n=1 Tax=Actinoalloteichus fjordicus TaxID=1612552 RepID=A0AAC9L9Q6_9PSEU|nr:MULTISPECIES: Sir2 family NAD-dependent protein deacetylase [Actinoalloteichus]APU12415.1 NAD-dependent protein deacetylase, SIR2 family [Actinoalloteichus fjordicus]APU18368.1 NAD-dependent protein deacetylase, SIR2 family [Actinoalloteichus sp. GBA129-24]
MAEAAGVSAAAGLIADAHALLVCAGAGMGVDSGLPDFRGPEGFWRAYPAYRDLGLSFAELADPVHFAADPALAWGFYGHRLALYRRTRPHAGFATLRRWGAALPGGLRVFTSNVDGQFHRAGFPDDVIAECHGSIHHLQCSGPCTTQSWSAADVTVEVDPVTMRAIGPLPACPHCGDLARPNILMFGDAHWVGERSGLRLDEVGRWRRGLRTSKLVVIELGAGTAVPTVRRQAELASAASGALIRINPVEPEVRHGRGVALRMSAADALAAVDELLPAPFRA